MELIEATVPVGRKELVLAPLGDIQWNGRPSHIALEPLKAHIAEALARDAYFIGTGDYTDFLSPSNRARLRGAALHETAEEAIDDKGVELARELYEEILKPTRGRWLGLVEGHHFSNLMDGTTSDMWLARQLKTRFLGTSAVVNLRCEIRKNNWGSVKLWIHHGAGSGQTCGAPLNRLEKLPGRWPGIDVFMIGHQTKIVYAPVPAFEANFRAQPPRLEQKIVHLVGVGGWFKGFEEHSRHGQVPRGGYVERGMLQPVVLGAPLISIEPYIAETATQKRKAEGHRQMWAPRIRVLNG